MAVTIKDIAKVQGCPPTVSRALNDHPELM